MDYVDDVCMDNLTVDQTKRMRKHWHAFRDKKARGEHIDRPTARVGYSV